MSMLAVATIPFMRESLTRFDAPTTLARAIGVPSASVAVVGVSWTRLGCGLLGAVRIARTGRPLMSMFKWDVVDIPPPGEAVGPHAAARVGQDGRARRPARGGDVRRHLRLPARHGAGPQPGDHVLGHLHDPVPADHARTRCRATSAPARRSWPASPRSAPRAATPPTSPARSWSPASCSPLVGVLVHFAGLGRDPQVLPPAVTGAVVMLIGFNLAPVVAGIYWPQDQWIALLTATFMVVRRGAASRASGRGSRCSWR